MSIRRFTIPLLAAAAAAVLGLPGMAAAAPATGHGAMIARNHTARGPVNCASGYCVNFQENNGGSPEWTQTEWISNPDPKHYVRGHARCVIPRTTTAATVNGGWVTSLRLWSRATCPDSRYVIIHAGWQVKNCSTCAVTTVWQYPTVLAGRRGR